ncbi:hypothetical protein Aab01nite_78850 [Paractinoplanes abujensis]|uniref:Lipoprotein n=1 Tax=Paractinoplanes abujensis TaxID=882441 RepID=A0A7W7CRY9_9ACTN|nr:hypothetical protein [Actinoplanes abujensis]MBB4692225.1 hypothetical protein [Actinoplanes abujensis]GID24295.1 hypothetical protein Aab01nite_78850 [Actinoplanes abujensis]
MRFTRGTLLAALALAITATAACSPRDTPTTAAPGASATTATANTGFGGSPRPTTTVTTEAPKPVKSEAPPATRPAPTATKTREPQLKDWAAAVKPCPYRGQKVEILDGGHEDVTKDGIMDTMVTRSCEASTSYWANTIEVFKNTTDPRGAERIGTLLEDVAEMDQPVVEQVLYNKGVIEIKAYGTSAKGAKACPDLILFYRYEYIGGKFKRTWRDQGFKDECKLQ